MFHKDRPRFIILILLLVGIFGTIFTHFTLNATVQNNALMQSEQITIQTFLNADVHEPITNTAIQHRITLAEMTEGLDNLTQYETPEGFKMVSDSKQWTVAKLEALYQELKQNKHGEEFNLLYQVFVHASPDPDASGAHQYNDETFVLNLNLPFLPERSQLRFTQNLGTINLYDGDSKTSIDDHAQVLSHEYGHHFTFYHMFKENQIEGSLYESIRNINTHPVFYDNSDYDHYLANHEWYLIEIAAEDYVQLMGSPRTKRIIKYVDVEGRLYGAQQTQSGYSYNVYGQENLQIPYAHEVEGLDIYFKSFIQESANSTPDTIKFKPSIERSVRSHDSTSGLLNFTHYTIRWDDVYPNSTYTLIMSDPDGSNLYAIKTVYPNQTMSAKVGTVSYEANGYIHWNEDKLDSGQKHFFVTVVLPDGSLRKSEPLSVNFN